ncbi:MAG: hypothetical protein WBB23_17200, partial [Desulforhopalus sp.]
GCPNPDLRPEGTPSKKSQPVGVRAVIPGVSFPGDPEMHLQKKKIWAKGVRVLCWWLCYLLIVTILYVIMYKKQLSRISHEHCVDFQDILFFQEVRHSFNFSLTPHKGGTLFSPHALWGISALEVTLRF